MNGDVQIDFQDLLIAQGAFDEEEYEREFNDFLDEQEVRPDEGEF